MSGEDRGDDRLSKNEFAELIQHLPVQEMFLIEYNTGSGWRKLFSRNAFLENQFNCHLCNMYVSCFKNLLAHIQGRKHVMQLRTAISLYHPEYTYPKDKEPNTVIDDPPQNNIEVTLTKEKGAVTKSKNDEEQVLQAGKTPEKKEEQIVSPEKKDKSSEKKKELKSSQTDKSPEKNIAVVEKVADKHEEKKVSQTDKVMEKNRLKKTSPPTNKISDKVHGKNGSSVKKTDIVINPVAVASNVAEKTSENKPVYQTNKIIIPTAVKNKPTKEARTMSPSKNSPMFSTKTYSSKPSDDEIYGILGVEYVIKLLSKNKESSPRYECGLCEIVLDAFAMQRHLEGYNHRLKFCEKHFPTAIRHYRQYMQGISEHDMFKVMTPVLAKLAVAIEKHHGRNLPYECYENDFVLHRHDILAKAFSCRHASEQYGPTFTHVIDSKEIDKYINERHLYTPPTPSRSLIFDRKSGKYGDKEPPRFTSSTSLKTSVHKDRHRNVVRENNRTLVEVANKNPKSNKLVAAQNRNFIAPNATMNTFMPNSMDNTHLLTPNNFPQHNIMEPYRSNAPGNNFNPSGFSSNNFTSNNMIEPFMTNPTQGYSMPTTIMPNYPSHNNQMQTVDDQTYNKTVDEFLRGTLKGMPGSTSRKRSPPPSHTSFPRAKRSNIDGWSQSRIEDSAGEEIAKLDARFRKYRLDPETYPQYNDEWQKFWKRRKDELIAAGQDHRSYNYQPEWVKFIKARIEALYKEELDQINLKSGGSIHHLSFATTASTSNTSVIGQQPQTETEHTQVVSVLRLMAALEENLGSLGPKIISLLSKALQLEKTNRGEIVINLMNDENYSVIETAKEKFKGLLLAGIVEGSKHRAMQKAVEEAEFLLASTQQQRHQSRAQGKTANVSESQTKAQQIPSIADILRVLRAHSNQK